MDDIRARIESGAQSRGEKLKLILKVKEATNSYFKHDVFISISNTHFDVYQIGGSLSVKAYSWFILKKIYLKENTLFLEFNDQKISFIYPEMEQVYDLILDILPRILKSNELLFAGILPTNSQPKPNPNSALLRLKQKIKYSNNPSQKSSIQYITDALTYTPYEIDLSRLKDAKITIPLFIDILPLLLDIQSIVINTDASKMPYFMSNQQQSSALPFDIAKEQRNFDIFATINDFVQNTGNVEHIEIQNLNSPNQNPNISQSFEKFMRGLEKSQSSNISCLSFTNSELTEQNLSSILGYMKEKRCSSLSLVNSLPQKLLSFFYFNFITDPSVSNLIELRIEDTQGLNLHALLPAIENISILSLSGCFLDINRTLVKLSKITFPNLTALNLSNNLCFEQISNAIVLPNTLTTLMVDSIEWKDTCLISFFQMLKDNFKRGLRLSMSNSKASESEWKNAYSFMLNSFESPEFFRSLVWDNNILNEQFFDFLKTQKKIEYLSLNYCFNDKDSFPLINKLADFLNKSQSLRSLSIRGDEDKYIGSSLNIIIECLRTRENAKPLDYLDISNSKSSDAGIELIKTLMQSKNSPHLLIIDGAEPIKTKTLLDFLDFALEVAKDVCISFPKNDLDYLARLKRINETQYTAIKEKFKIPEGKDKRNEFEAPFSIFMEHKNPNFPKYVTRSFLTKYKMIKETTTQKTFRPYQQNSSQNVPGSPKSNRTKGSNIHGGLNFTTSSDIEKSKRRPVRKPFDYIESPKSKEKSKTLPQKNIINTPDKSSKNSSAKQSSQKQQPQKKENSSYDSGKINIPKRSASQMKKPKTEKQSKNISLEKEKNSSYSHLMPLYLTSDGSSWREKRSQSNIALISSHAEISSDFLSGTNLSSTQDSSKLDDTGSSPMKGIRAPKGKVERLNPSASISKIIPSKRKSLIPNQISDNSSIPKDQTMIASSTDKIQIREPQKPPNPSSPRRAMKQIISPVSSPTRGSSPFTRSNRQSKTTKQQASTKKNQQIRKVPLKLNEESESSSSLLQTIDTSTPSTPKKNENPFDNKSDSQKPKQIKQKEPPFIIGNWSFPVPRITTPDPWQELQELYSLDENMKMLSKVPHQHY